LLLIVLVSELEN